MNPPILTRIVTAFRQWSFITQWIGDDALFPTGIEWIIVNDAPKDKAPAELQAKLDARGIQVLTYKANMGRSYARNRGAAAATGEWLDFIDGDDLPLVFDPAQLAALDADFVTHPIRHAFFHETPFLEGARAPVEESDAWSPFFNGYAPVGVAPCALSWRRSFFLELGGYDGRFDGAEDFQLVFRAKEAAAHLGRCDRPKQCYFSRKVKHSFQAAHIYGHRRLYEYIKDESADPQTAHEAAFWLGKEAFYEFILGWRLAWKYRSPIWQFAKIRLWPFR